MKVVRIIVENVRSILKKEIELNGCSAIVTGKNNGGKSTMLKSLADRIFGKIPKNALKKGEKKGYVEYDFSDGAKCIWKMTENSESLQYITPDDLKINSGVIKILQDKYFGQTRFEIDSFLSKSPKEQQKQLLKVFGVDIEHIEDEYKVAYQNRTDANRELKRLNSITINPPEMVEKPNIEALKEKKEKIRFKLNDDYIKNKNQNELLRQKYEKENLANDALKSKIEKVETLLIGLKELGYNGKEVDEFLNSFPKPCIIPEPEYVDEMPDNKELINIEKEIDIANDQLTKYNRYEMLNSQYIEHCKNLDKAKKEADEKDNCVKSIEEKKSQALSKIDLPEGFEFSESGLLYNSFPLTRDDQSTSALYIAALKLSVKTLGELRSIHFDASFLDNESLSNVVDYADENDLQILIERPDYNGGEISYTLINESTNKH